LALLQQWTAEIKRHCPSIKQLIWRGEGKDASGTICTGGGHKRRKRRVSRVSDLQKQEIVITTYDTVVACDRLQEARWHRVVLDEAHKIRNDTTQKRRVLALKAKCKLCLTGTPVMNRESDLTSLFVFLGARKEYAQSHLASLRRLLLLRRMKTDSREIDEDEADMEDDMHAAGSGAAAASASGSVATGRMRRPLIQLPPKVERVQLVGFSAPSEGTLYRALFDLSSKKLQSFEKQGNRNQYTQVLALLTRLRQCALHWRLVEKSMAVKSADDMCKLMMQRATAVSAAVSGADEDEDEDEELKRMAALEAGGERVSDESSANSRRHGRDGAGRGSDGEFEGPVFRRPGSAGSSTKLELLLRAIEHQPEGSRCLVFSEFASFLHIAQRTIEGAGYRVLPVHGKMLAPERQQNISTFQSEYRSVVEDSDTDGRGGGGGDSSSHDELWDDTGGEDADAGNWKENKLVMLITTACGSEGLNLTAATHVYLMEPSYNPFVEKQAVDRAYRLGRSAHSVHTHRQDGGTKGALYVTRFVIKGTIEAQIQQLQQQKQSLADRLLGAGAGLAGRGSVVTQVNAENIGKLNISQLRRLFVTHEEEVLKAAAAAEEDDGDDDDDDDEEEEEEEAEGEFVGDSMDEGDAVPEGHGCGEWSQW
jgi:SNF2 family DNA or RNA helicase